MGLKYGIVLLLLLFVICLAWSSLSVRGWDGRDKLADKKKNGMFFLFKKNYRRTECIFGVGRGRFRYRKKR